MKTRLNSKLDNNLNSWPQIKLIKMVNGDIILTTKQKGTGMLLYTESDDNDIGYLFQTNINPLKMEDIERVIEEPLEIIFNSK